jgi:hypothetical protein
MKKCSDCGELKELSEFYSQNKIRKDGTTYMYHNPECKECTKNRTVRWQEKNLDKKRAYALKDNAKPHRKQQMKALNKKRRENGEYQKWQRDNPEKIKGYNIYREMHKKHDITDDEWENCKNYFNYRCAYCGIKIEDHWIKFKGSLVNGDFHREHVDDEGENDLSNCIPSCKSCNGSKHTSKLEDWYNDGNLKFSQERLNKIHNWLDEDYMKFITINY